MIARLVVGALMFAAALAVAVVEAVLDAAEWFLDQWGMR